MRPHTKIVLAVSQGVAIPSGEAQPDRDFLALARALGATVVGNREPAAGPLLAPVERATGLDLRQAAFLLRHHADAAVFVSFSERIGIPLGIALARQRRRPRHLLIAHRLDTGAKRLLRHLGRWTAGVDRILTLCGAQDSIARERYRASCRLVRACVVDDAYFRPAEGVAEEDYVLSVGSESRDYATLLAAAAELPYRFRILASSPWTRRAARVRAAANVELLAPVSDAALRELYARARLVVAPLLDVPYAAGLNGVEEALAMGRPLVVSASRGIADYVRHGKNALVVPPGDAGALAAAIEAVHTGTELRARLRAGAERARTEFVSLGTYVKVLEDEVRALIEGGAGRPA